jgi:cellulose synthase/poly-beta-1,6-N-acetylglucosamine synthase-like glycosyltransferase
MAAASVRPAGSVADAPIAPASQPAGERVALSVVVPAWREALRIGASLERIAAHLAARPWSAEVIVVDDGSDDGTAEEVLARRALLPRLRLLRHAERRGKGAALRSGVLAARGDALRGRRLRRWDCLGCQGFRGLRRQ